MGKIATLELKLDGSLTLHCSGCENTVEHALAALQGVRRVRADRRTQRVEVLYDPDEADLDQITSRLETLGYNAVPV
ncbi:MAG: heavy-metal-associated domain-containing protein [Anaerolineae bacterium]